MRPPKGGIVFSLQFFYEVFDVRLDGSGGNTSDDVSPSGSPLVTTAPVVSGARKRLGQDSREVGDEPR